jgi:Ca2+/H+ antiporter, TMEM165/GDT1 family
MKGRWALKAVKMLGMVLVGSLVIGGIVMMLWNALIPELFKGPVITFWQAVGLLVLSHILLRGWGHRGHGWSRDRWSHRFEEKLAAMTPEEREKFKNDWRHRCGGMPSDTDAKEK